MRDNEKLFLIIIVLVGAFWWWRHAPAEPTVGQSAPDDPVQTMVWGERPLGLKGFLIRPLARYDITARILHRQEYHFDDGAVLSPLDLALGWGPMSDPANYNRIHWSQDGRWYEYSYDGTLPQNIASRIVHCSANNHLIPSTDTIRDKILSFRVNQTINLKGFLVEVTNPQGFKWTSSLSRDDTGAGSCELMWVETAESMP